MATGEGVVLEFAGVSKSFRAGGRRVAAVREVSWRVRAGVVTGLIGPDGAGKTTLMRMAAGLLKPDAGRVTVLGFDATKQSLAVQSRLGYMPQRFGLYEDLTVLENLNLYADLQGVVREDRPPRYEELMHMTGLGDFRGRLAGRLSGGMKQKLGLACTLVRAPQLLLLDEPTVGVDPVSRRELWEIVYRLVHDEGMSVMLSTAYLDEAERCSEVAIMHEGQILGQGPPGDFSGPMEGRSYAVRVEGMSKRRVQERLVKAEGVLDAVVQADHVRVVMEGERKPEELTALGGMEGVKVEGVRARFEDGFIALLRKKRAKTDEGAAAAGSEERRWEGTERVIEVHEATRRFGEFTAVKGVSFAVNRGEIFGLLGPNGAGKSTTFRMLCGLLPASGGKLSVAGVDLRRAAAAARERIGYMSQKFSLYGNLSVRENLEFFSRAYGLKGKKRAERLKGVTEEFGLGPMAEATSSDLPLGYKQRLAMACALMHEPEILFLDEPTSGVDPLARREFWGRINALAEAGVTVMVTTHFMEEAEYCDRLAIMWSGEILALGPPGEIRRRGVTVEIPHPTMEEAFIELIKTAERTRAGA